MSLKRVFDLAVASSAMIMLGPLLLMISIVIKLTSEGPVLFRQRRFAPNGKEILLYKFRTMRVTDAPNDVTRVPRLDTRVTTVGRILRLTFLDELPQLLNVLEGKMSIVGPRAHGVRPKNIDTQKHVQKRVDFPPGMTGLAQLNGFRRETFDPGELSRRSEHDRDYMQRWSLWLDIKILWKTIIAVIRDDTRDKDK